MRSRVITRWLLRRLRLFAEGRNSFLNGTTTTGTAVHTAQPDLASRTRTLPGRPVGLYSRQSIALSARSTLTSRFTTAYPEAPGSSERHLRQTTATSHQAYASRTVRATPLP